MRVVLFDEMPPPYFTTPRHALEDQLAEAEEQLEAKRQAIAELRRKQRMIPAGLAAEIVTLETVCRVLTDEINARTV